MTWSELWDEWHHQGDAGEASYAALAHLVRIHAMHRGMPDSNAYELAATIELARRSNHNPDLPAWLRESYDAAWPQFFGFALRDLEQAKDDLLVRNIVAVLALAKDQATLAEMALLTEDERKEMLRST